jgi:hypothetical protein
MYDQPVELGGTDVDDMTQEQVDSALLNLPPDNSLSTVTDAASGITGAVADELTNISTGVGNAVGKGVASVLTPIEGALNPWLIAGGLAIFAIVIYALYQNQGALTEAAKRA